MSDELLQLRVDLAPLVLLQVKTALAVRQLAQRQDPCLLVLGQWQWTREDFDAALGLLRVGRDSPMHEEYLRLWDEVRREFPESSAEAQT